jgi:multiple sugar transport system permease protein
MRSRAARLIGAGTSNLIIIVLGIGMLYPVVWLIAASFKETNTIFSDPSLMPKAFTIKKYFQGWKGIGIVGFGTFFMNSFALCALCVVANVAFCSLTAYAFGRLRFAGRNFWFAVMMLTLMLPAHVTTPSSSSCSCSSYAACPRNWTNPR